MVQNIYCIEFGETSVKLAEVIKQGNLFNIIHLNSVEINPIFFTTDIDKVNEDHANLIKKLVNNAGITKKNVNIIIPDAYSYNQIIEMPKLNEKELISAIRYQADQFIPMPIDEATIDIEILRENEENKTLTVLMVAASKNIINKIQKTIELAGLLPESIENELSASTRFINEYYNNSKEDNNILFINFGFKTTSLYVYNTKMKTMIQTRNIKSGLSIFLKEIAMNLNINQIQASEILKAFNPDQKTSIPVETYIHPVISEFTTEIKQFISIISQKNKSQISNVFFFNEAIHFRALTQLIKKDIQIPISFFSPMECFQQNEIISINKNNLAFFISTIGGNLK